MSPDEAARRRKRFLRLRAVLAGGLVLGVGATPTLASWTDRELAVAAFTASSFTTESSVQGGAYAGNSASPGAIVTMQATGFLPGAPQYFAMRLRTTATSVGGSVVMAAGVVGGADALTIGSALRLRVVRTTATCDATAFGGSSLYVVGGSATYRSLTAPQESGVFTLLTPASASSTGFCFEVGLPAGAPGSLQGSSATATWHFVATSS